MIKVLSFRFQKIGFHFHHHVVPRNQRGYGVEKFSLEHFGTMLMQTVHCLARGIFCASKLTCQNVSNTSKGSLIGFGGIWMELWNLYI